MMTKLDRALACGVALGALLTAAGGAMATDFIVPAGPPAGQRVLPGAGDTLLIETGGSIVTVAVPGVYMNNIDQSVTNNGGITTSGNFSDAIASTGANAQIDNSGNMTTSGLSAFGIYSFGPLAQIGNSGDISTSGNSAYGIFSQGTDAQINNNGGITTSGNSAFGIYSIGADAGIDNSGDVTTSGQSADGISSHGADAQIINSGDITTSGQSADGIFSTGADALITNSGDITTSGVDGYGIWSTGADAHISNSGDITTSGANALGVWSQGAFAQIRNSGDITTSGANAHGIWSQGAFAQITNNGDITTSGLNSVGIYSFGPKPQIINTGDITTSGTNSSAIFSSGNDAQISNSGSITTSGEGAAGIISFGQNATVTNSGRVFSELGYAIAFTRADATLNLLAGSAIQGGIGFFQSGSATLNIGPGLNTALTVEGVPDTVNAYGAPMVIQGALVAVVDPTGFSAQDETLTDLTRAIAGAIDGRLNAARFGNVPLSGPVTAYVEPDAPAGTQAMDFGYGTGAAASAASGFWAAGLGSYRDQGADGVDVGFDSSLAGLLIGYDSAMSASTRVGAFLGASTSSFETDGNSQEIDADSYFGGVYAGLTSERYFLDLAVTGGVSQQSSDRAVANNLVVGGIEHARADYDGVFISPSASIGTTFATANGGTLIPSMRARYAGLFLDGYEETGSAADLTVGDRDVNIFDFRAQLGYALASKPVNDGAVHTMVRIGADATFADNDNVEAALLGTGLNFNVSGDDTVRGFVGADLSYRIDSGSSFFLGAEAGYDSGDAFTLDVRGGFAVPL